MGDVLILLTGIAVAVLLEVAAFRAYQGHRRKKEERFTVEQLGPLYEDLQGMWRHLAQEEEVLCRWAEARDGEPADSSWAFLAPLARAKRFQRGNLETLFTELGEEPPSAPSASAALASPALSSTAALSDLAARAQGWAYDTAPELARRAKAAHYANIARTVRQVAEVEGAHAEVVKRVAQGAQGPVDELSACPSCGSLCFGRRPAFCLVCNHPGFEMETLVKGR